MARRITTGIDIGTRLVKVVIAELPRSRERVLPRVIGTGIAEAKGMRHGYVTNVAEVARSVGAAVRQAEKAAGISVKRAHVGVSGIGLDEIRTSADVVISRGDLEVTELDIEKALSTGEEKIARQTLNKKIIHEIPLRFVLDDAPVPGRPIGLKGAKLSVDMLFVTCFEQHLQDLIQAVEEAGVAVDDVMAGPIASSLVALTKTQKIAGVVLANIGAETVSIGVFENGVPVSVKVFSIGSADITNDIALGLKIPLDDAEKAKVGSLTGIDYPQKKLDEIIAARLTDIFELIDKHLTTLGKNGLLPAGIVMTGGTARITRIADIARDALSLPAKAAVPGFGKQSSVKDPVWAVAYGLALWGFSVDEESMGVQIVRQTHGGILAFIKRFLP